MFNFWGACQISNIKQKYQQCYQTGEFCLKKPHDILLLYTLFPKEIIWDWSLLRSSRYRISLNSIRGNYVLWHLQTGKLFQGFKIVCTDFLLVLVEKGNLFKGDIIQGRLLIKEIRYLTYVHQLLCCNHNKNLFRRLHSLAQKFKAKSVNF